MNAKMVLSLCGACELLLWLTYHSGNFETAASAVLLNNTIIYHTTIVPVPGLCWKKICGMHT